MSLDNNGLQAPFAESSDAVWLVFVTISHAGLTDGPLRMVRNSKDVVKGGETYTALMFDIILPGQHERQASIASVTLPNVDRAITDAIRPLAASDTPVDVRLEVALASEPDATQHGPWYMVLMDVIWNADTVRGQLHPVVDLDQAWPEAKMDNARFPGLFAG